MHHSSETKKTVRYYIGPLSWFMIHVMAALVKPIDLARI